MQSDLYATYHMTDAQRFYNREDPWAIARETYSGQAQAMEGYYQTMRLPGEASAEFALIRPFTPGGQNRDNMVAWLAARADPAHYGQLVVYEFPRTRNILGPLQVDARLNQEPGISSALTLLDQRGSRVVRGNLLVIPFDDALLYVQPLYIQAENSPFPELKRIIAASTESIVMADTLDAALAGLTQGRRGVITGTLPPSAATTTTANPPSATGQPADLARQALAAWERAQQAQARGDWTAYGAALADVDRLLRQLAGP